MSLPISFMSDFGLEDEFVGVVHAVLRRMDAAEQLAASRAGMIRRGALSIDPVAREVRVGERGGALTGKGFDLQAVVGRQGGRTVVEAAGLDRVAGGDLETALTGWVGQIRDDTEDWAGQKETT